MGIRAYSQIPLGEEGFEMKLTGRLYHAVFARVPRLHVLDKLDGMAYLQCAFTLTPDEVADVADRLFAECHMVEYDKFQYGQQYWNYIFDLKTAFVLSAAAKRGESISFG